MGFVEALLLCVFGGGGAFLIALGALILAPLYGWRSVEVEAECVDTIERNVEFGSAGDRTVFPGARKPVYRYYYNGVRCTASPMLTSNRPGYHPERGWCTIRINPKHPERVYSSERRFAAAILMGIGACWIAAAVLVGLLVP